MRSKQSWETIYREKRTPWDARQPEPWVVQFVESGAVKPCKALDIGCGPGNESVFLARKGFNVTGVDISEHAIHEAKRRARVQKVDMHFVASDFLAFDSSEKFDFVLDRACFHFVEESKRSTYLEKLNKFLNPSAVFLLFASSDVETLKGPYQFSKEDLKRIFSPYFDIRKIELVKLETHAEKAMPYVCLMWKKHVVLP